MVRPQDALAYHSEGRPGKLEIHPTKPSYSQQDLSLAYSPGVAEPCREIAKRPEDSFLYTARGNLVAVVSNGTAVLGLGDIGPLAAKPVMEGKAILFKRFADIDVFDIELDCKDVDAFCKTVKALEPTFGGVNLEDIKAPECFEIERRLSAEMDIPVFHDDQHGTAIISGAAFLNWLELCDRSASDVRVVFSGAGASALACANMMLLLGVERSNLIVCDSQGVLRTGRGDEPNEYKRPFVRETELESLEEALVGADVFVGLSRGGIMTGAMIEKMADRPLVMALSNPDPEIPYEEARRVRPDAIVCTGRSDHPNQVNNVLGFPYLFRGALDVRARAIDEGMKLAAVHAIAELAREPVPSTVSHAYGGSQFEFGPEYLIPKPMDPRVLTRVAPAVARAACASGIARHVIEDWDEYVQGLGARLGQHSQLLRFMSHEARAHCKRIVFPEGDHEKVLKAAVTLVEDRLAKPVLIGDPSAIRREIERLELADHLSDGRIEIIDPARSAHYERYWKALFERRQRKGVSRFLAQRAMKWRLPFASMMLAMNDADGMVAGLADSFPNMLGPLLRIVGLREGCARAAGVHLVVHRNEPYFFADTTAQISPSAEGIAEIAISTARLARQFGVAPKVALLSFSNFGSVEDGEARKMARASEIIRERCGDDLIVDGEMQADTALMPEFRQEHFPFSHLEGKANVLVFPNLAAGNISYKIAQHFGASAVIGPLLVGLTSPIGLVTRYASVGDVIQEATAISMLAGVEQRHRGE
ncbi:MAG: NADP-dependent malic enzyme [Planctomycetes bacterium]|nr:NADP-dependent malic enzyme [Planctomycetota bacterium]